jgi:hypothetical protein
MRARSGMLACVLPLLVLSACPVGSPPVSSSSAPTITTQPQNQTVPAGQTVTFAVVASGTPTPTYQWQNAANSTNIAGATSASYAIASTTTNQSGMRFQVVVSNPAGSKTSNVVTLTVNAAQQAPTITTQPQNQTVTTGQTATFTVVASGTPAPTYQWQNAANGTNIAGATSASYAIASTTNQSGMRFQAVASNVAGSITSNVVTLTVNPATTPSNVTVLTYHNDVGRTGQNLNETTLTTSNVNSSQFGSLGTISVDGLVDAEPLYVGGMTINGSTHNVLFVATENDSVYALDADTFAQLWQVSMLGTNEVASDGLDCTQIQPTIGITSTPVIDITAGPNGAIFVVAMSKQGTTYFQRLHALDLATGSDLKTATTVAATAPGTGTGSSNGTQTFAAAAYEERAALLLLNGVIYTTWSSHCDAAPYNSWVIGYNESTLAQQSVMNLTANGTTQGGEEGGIWMAGSGPAADSSGNIYFLIGNGTFDTTLNGSGFPNQGDYGNSFMKLSTTGGSLTVADYFTMHNACCVASVSESNTDTDLGSGGAMVLPDILSGGNTYHLAVGAGKDTNMYIVNRNNMGHFNASNDSAIYQELVGALSGGIWSAPAYFNNTIYYCPEGHTLMAFPITNAQVASSPSSTTSPQTFLYPGTTPSISANGAANGIVWAIETEQGSITGTLFAYTAPELSLLFSGTFTTNSNDKFVTPMIANGKVYVGAGPTSSSNGGSVAVFGVLNQGAALVKTPIRRPRHRWSPTSGPPRPGSSTPGQ